MTIVYDDLGDEATGEVPVRKILLGTPPEQAANTSAMADPSSLDAFIDYARTQHDYTTEP